VALERNGLCIEPNSKYWYGLSHRKCAVAGAFLGSKQEQVDVKFRGVFGGIVGLMDINRKLEPRASTVKRYKAENVIGSTTACIAVFDNIRHQLHFSNLGDSGIIVLRHIDSDVAGSLKRDRQTPRNERKSDLRVAFVSQQQLRSFNHPFQLGWIGEEMQDKNTSFKPPTDSCSSSIHVRRGDLIIMATDGLFDNVDIDEITAVALEWEQQNGFIRGGDIAARERRWSMGNSLTMLSAERIRDLAQALCKRARENSLNSEVDSPFAILAKENDIMWSGGMPDDCTVIAMHIVGRSAEDLMGKTKF
jgi:protein phosphatase PTC7